MGIIFGAVLDPPTVVFNLALSVPLKNQRHHQLRQLLASENASRIPYVRDVGLLGQQNSC